MHPLLPHACKNCRGAIGGSINRETYANNVTTFLFLRRQNKKCHTKKGVKRQLERSTQKLGKRTLDSTRKGIRRKNPHHKTRSPHKPTLPQRQKRNHILLQRRSRYNPKKPRSHAERRRRHNPQPKNNPQNHRQKELSPI